MNKWFKLALISFIGIILLNLIMSLMFSQPNYYPGGGYHMNQMHNGMRMMK